MKFKIIIDIYNKRLKKDNIFLRFIYLKQSLLSIFKNKKLIG